MQDLRAELAGTMGEAEWDWLMPHAERNALVLVGEGLDLLDVGVAIASDHTTMVQRWIDEGLIQKPSPEQIKAWSNSRNKRFNALILQPYVLVQHVAA
ncbi:MAG: DUF2288 domain-containing protein [Elainellaceae cyanobacterium]|jgi:hypothetical protein